MKKSLLNVLRASKKKQINSFYLGVLYKGQSSYLRVLNYILYRLFVLIFSFLIFLYFTEGQRPLSAFAAGISVLVIYHYLSSTFFNKKFTQIKTEVNAKIAEEEFWGKIKAMDKEGFVQYIQEILSKLPQFSQIEITEYLEGEGIDLICKYNNDLVAIQCHILDGDNAVESRSARELSKAISKRKYLKGIIISTTDFRDDTRRFCNLIKEKRQIILLGQKDLIQMAMESDKYPKEEEIKNVILKKIERQNRTFSEAKDKLFTRPRLKPYFIYGTLLLFCGLFFFEYSIRYLYLLGATGLYLLGTIGFIVNIKSVKKVGYNMWQEKLF